jgi:P pilus assembly chaperone PapD
VIIAVAAIALVSAVPPAHAQVSVEATPLRIEITAEPGSSHTQAITLTNPGTEPVRVKVSIADWHLSRDGAPQFQQPEATREYAAASWVRFAPPELVLEPGKQGTVRFTLTVPVDVKAGGYRTGLLFEFVPLGETAKIDKGRQIILRSRIASLIYVNIGQIAAAVELTNLQVKPGPDTQIVAGLKNTSRRTVRTRGSLMLYDGSGIAVATIPVPDVPVLPESERDVAIMATEALKTLLSGDYKVELKLDLGMPALVVGETTLKVAR